MVSWKNFTGSAEFVILRCASFQDYKSWKTVNPLKRFIVVAEPVEAPHTVHRSHSALPRPRLSAAETGTVEMRFVKRFGFGVANAIHIPSSLRFAKRGRALNLRFRRICNPAVCIPSGITNPGKRSSWLLSLSKHHIQFIYRQALVTIVHFVFNGGRVIGCYIKSKRFKIIWDYAH